MTDPRWVPGRGNNTDTRSLHPASQHRASLALNIPLHHIRLLICLLFCPDTAVKVPGPLVGAVLSLHPLTADEIGHL